jgi:hypothetical protein
VLAATATFSLLGRVFADAAAFPGSAVDVQGQRMLVA